MKGRIIIPILTRIRVRILAIVLMAIVPAIVLIFCSASERKSQISREIEDNAVRLSSFLASNLERDLSEGKVFLKASAELIHAKGLVDSGCGETLLGLFGNSSVYFNMGVGDWDGRIKCSGRTFPMGANLASLKWFKSALLSEEFTVGFDFSGILSHEASIILAYPISGSGGKPVRILFAVMDLEWLNRLALDARLPPSSAISVTNKKGDAVARYPDPDKWVGKSYPRAHVLENDGRANGVSLAKGIDGVKRLYAYTTVPGKGDLVVHVGIRREAILEPANMALKNQLLALGVVSLLAILAAWFGSDLFLLKQVRALIQATKNLAAGNLGARSSLSYETGELGELARAFDVMAETLEWREAQLRESEIDRADPAGFLFEFLDIISEPCLVIDESLEILTANSAARNAFCFPEGISAWPRMQALFPGLNVGEIMARIPPDDLPASAPFNTRVKVKCTKGGGPSRIVEISVSKFTMTKKSFIMILMRECGEPMEMA
jgi:hypothetical protein